MAEYEIVAPCAYIKDGRVVRHRRPGATVELDRATAARLGPAARPARRPREPKTDNQPKALATEATAGTVVADTKASGADE